MAGSAVELDVSELNQLTGELASAMNRLAMVDKRQLLHDLGVEMEGQTVARFEDKEAPDGSSWKTWDPKYAERKRKSGSGGSILQDSGQLRGSITGAVESTGLVVGSREVYARVHQEGWPDKNIPARPYLGISQENQDDLVTIMTDFVKWASGGVL